MKPAARADIRRHLDLSNATASNPYTATYLNSEDIRPVVNLSTSITQRDGATWGETRRRAR